MNQPRTIENLVEFGKGEYFLEVNNNVGQRWYFPYKNIKGYLSIFRPSSLAGKIIRSTLPLTKHLAPVHSFLKMKRVRLCMFKEIEEKISHALNHKEWGYAIFCGSPGKHQKATVLVRNKYKILGYCKISDNEEIIKIFKKEKDILDYLYNNNVDMIPKVLLCDKIDGKSDTWLYIQSTKEKQKICSPTIYSKEIYDFIEDIGEKTELTLNYEDTEYSIAIDSLKNSHLTLFDKTSRNTLLRAINEVESKLKKGKNRYTFAHGDFTPWNCFVVDYKLFAFDFEYSQKTYPQYYDLLHFFTQSEIYDKSRNEEQIYEEYKEMKKRIFNRYIPVEECDFYYKCYLLGIIEFYLKRDNGALNNRIEHCFRIWIGLIDRIDNEEKINNQQTYQQNQRGGFLS